MVACKEPNLEFKPGFDDVKEYLICPWFLSRTKFLFIFLSFVKIAPPSPKDQDFLKEKLVHEMSAIFNEFLPL